METYGGRQDSPRTRSAPFRLSGAIVASLSALFVTLLALFTGDLGAVWPLFLIPVVIATVAYEVPGALIATATCAAITALLLPTAPGIALTPMVTGLAAILVCSIAVGLQLAANRKRTCALDEVSVIDPETGLLKRDAFMDRLAEEVQRGVRHDIDVSLAIVQVRESDSFRETFGAYKAQLMLEHMAEILRITVRSTDVIGRTGHDTFGLVAPFTGPDQAEIIAERIRQAVCGARFEGDALEPAIRCDVIVVYASTPREATGIDALVGLAEQRLLGHDDEAAAQTDGAPPSHSVVTAGT